MCRAQQHHTNRRRSRLTMTFSLTQIQKSPSAWLSSVVLLLLSYASIGLAGKTVSVRIFVDEEERRTERLWKQTLGKRLAKASELLAPYSEIRFAVTKFGSWDSEDGHNDFARSLTEFEKETLAKPAELAIGFTSQYRLQKGRSNLGGTRGPMRQHILLREGAKIESEVERLEVLVHELAHYLGAAHSPDQRSVMRPVLGDGQSRARSFQIRLDPANAKIVSLVSREMATQNVRTLHRLGLDTRVQVRDIYAQIARAFPEDEVAGRYVSVLERSIKFSVAERQRQIQMQKQYLDALVKKQKENSAKEADVSSSKATPK